MDGRSKAAYLLSSRHTRLGHNYKREDCKVVWITDGKVTVQDKAGLRWRFDDDGTYQEGDVVTLKMHTNFTSPVGDDTIKEVIR